MLKKITLRERVDVRVARYLLQVPIEQLEDLYINDIPEHGEVDNTRATASVEQMLKWLRKNLKIWSGDHKTVTTYKKSKNLQEDGRDYVSGYGIQKLKRCFRGVLCAKVYDDWDMSNAHPQLLMYMLNKYFSTHVSFPPNGFPYLAEYVEKRKEVLEKHKTTKHAILKILNGGAPDKSNKFERKFGQEMKIIHKMVYNGELPEPLSKYKKYRRASSVWNHGAKFLNVLLTIFEKECLDFAVLGLKKINVIPSVFMFDGFMVEQEYRDKFDAEFLNKVTERYGVKWTRKEHDTESVKIDTSIILETVDKLCSYDEKKKELEATTCWVKDPACIAVRDGKDYLTYSFNTWKELEGSSIRIWDEDEGCEVGIYKQWRDDPTKRVVRGFDFVPGAGEVVNDRLNLYTGFRYEDFERRDGTVGAYIEIFRNHISLLVGHHVESVEYLVKFFAHMLQKPAEHADVCIIIKSIQGMGKDMLVDIIENILGTEYVTRTSKIDSLLGQFNGDVEKKMLVVLNEASGKDGYEFKDKLKDFITQKSCVINKKNIQSYKVKCFHRTMLFSNNHNVVNVEADNRRYAVFKSHHLKETSSYYKRLDGLISDEGFLGTIAEYLLGVDITDYDPRCIPQTHALKSMRAHNLNPFYVFMKDMFLEGYWDELKSGEGMEGEWIEESDKAGRVRLKIRYDLFDALFENWRQDSQLYRQVFYKSRQVRTFLAEMGVVCKKHTKKDNRRVHYVFDVNNVVEQLEQMKIED